MKRFQYCLIFLLLPLLSSCSLQAKQLGSFPIGEINPSTSRLGVFNSYKHKKVIISFTQKPNQKFNCQPNRYVIFDSANNWLSEIYAGSVKASSDFEIIFSLKVLSLDLAISPRKNNLSRTKSDIQKELNISPSTLASGSSRGSNSDLYCWQQPELRNFTGELVKSFPYLAANQCVDCWCSELYWTSSNQIQLWIQQQPDQVDLVSLDTITNKILIKNSKPVKYKTDLKQLNAPRENLVTTENLSGKKINLTPGIALEWKTINESRIKIFLVKNTPSLLVVDMAYLKAIQDLIRQNQMGQAILSIDFALWLNPGNEDLKYQKLKTLAKTGALNEFFTFLSDSYQGEQQFLVCQKIHSDGDFRQQLIQETFSQRFREHCTQN